jgi:hypothetical protein
MSPEPCSDDTRSVWGARWALERILRGGQAVRSKGKEKQAASTQRRLITEQVLRTAGQLRCNLSVSTGLHQSRAGAITAEASSCGRGEASGSSPPHLGVHAQACMTAKTDAMVDGGCFLFRHLTNVRLRSSPRDLPPSMPLGQWLAQGTEMSLSAWALFLNQWLREAYANQIGWRCLSRVGMDKIDLGTTVRMRKTSTPRTAIDRRRLGYVSDQSRIGRYFQNNSAGTKPTLRRAQPRPRGLHAREEVLTAERAIRQDGLCVLQKHPSALI